MKHLNFLSKSGSRSYGHRVTTLALTVGSPSVHRRGTMLRLLSVLVLVLTLGVGNVWATDVTGTIYFGNNGTNINSTSVTGDDDLENTWTITTVFAGTQSFTQQASYSQVGANNKKANSITFTTTLPTTQTIKSFRAKFGGFSGTAGNITLKVGNSSVGTGSLNGTSDVTISASNTTTSGTVLTVLVEPSSAKGVKCYWIEYTYETGGGPTTYAVSYDKNNDGASGSMTDSSSPYTPGATVTVLDNGFTAPAGYTFDHWDTKADDSGTDYNPGDEFAISAATTLYAQWKSNAADKTFKLVEDVSKLSAGKNIVIVSYYSTNSTYYAMSSDRGNNRLAVAAGESQFTLSTDHKTLTTASATTLEMLTLTSTDAGYFGLKALNGDYLYAAASGSNQLKTKTYANGTLDNDSKWKITLTSGTFSVQADKSSNRYDMRYNYNSNNPALFSCYATGGSNPTVLIYAEKTCEELGQINGSFFWTTHFCPAWPAKHRS